MILLLLLSLAANAAPDKQSTASMPPQKTAEVRPEEDCTANFAELHSVLDAKALKSASPEKRDEAKRILVQSGTLKSGEKVKFQAGGCAHLAYSFEFNGAKFKRIRAANAFAAAEKLLAATPVTKTSPEKKKILLEALKAGGKKGSYPQQEPGVYKLPCGDATCLLDIHADKQITISYDMAL